MTISKYIADLLKNYEDIEIDANHVSDGSDKYGLFKSPSRDIRNFNDSSYEITEYYNFFARQKTLSLSERKEADEWLEDLTYWVDDLAVNYEFPPIDKKRKVIALSITGCPYPTEVDNKESTFQMSLAITYLREREDF